MNSAYIDLTKPGTGMSRGIPCPNSSSRRFRSLSVESSVTLMADDELQPTRHEDIPSEVIDLTSEDWNEDEPSILREGELLLVSYPCNSALVSRGQFLQITTHKMGTHQIDYLKVEAVVRLRSGQVVLRGCPFMKSENCHAMLNDDANEVCQLRHIHLAASGTSHAPLLLDASPDSVLATKDIRFTNEMKDTISELSVDSLFCRWSLSIYFCQLGARNRIEEESLERVRADDCDPTARIPEDILRFNWRGVTRKGGSYRSSPIQDNRREPGQKYTVFDAFAGGGGVSRGAVTAGFKVIYALDHAPEV